MLDELLNIELEEVKLDKNAENEFNITIEETLAAGCGAILSCNGCISPIFF